MTTVFVSASRRVVWHHHLLRRCPSPTPQLSNLHICSTKAGKPTSSTCATYSFQQHACNNVPHQIQKRHMVQKSVRVKKKGANDIAKAKDHAKATRAIEAASRACAGDMTDLQLHSAISAARAAQLPKERMEKAIERGANPHRIAEGEEYVVRRYDGMVPTGASGKVAVIVETLTENRNRTAGNVRHKLTKTGGELLPTGANEWLFEHVGLIWVSKFKSSDDSIGDDGDGDVDPSIQGAEVDMDALLECALEGGATDVEFGIEESDSSAAGNDNETGNHAMIKCETNDMLHLVQALKADGYVTTQFENQWLVKDEGNTNLLDKESAEKFEKFLSSMDDDLDVTNVFHNASFVDDNI